MMAIAKSSPFTGRGTKRSLVEGVRRTRNPLWPSPSIPPLRVAVPLPANGEE
jgi:hypothetical protein